MGIRLLLLTMRRVAALPTFIIGEVGLHTSQHRAPGVVQSLVHHGFTPHHKAIKTQIPQAGCEVDSRTIMPAGKQTEAVRANNYKAVLMCCSTLMQHPRKHTITSTRSTNSSWQVDIVRCDDVTTKKEEVDSVWGVDTSHASYVMTTAHATHQSKQFPCLYPSEPVARDNTSFATAGCATAAGNPGLAKTITATAVAIALHCSNHVAIVSAQGDKQVLSPFTSGMCCSHLIQQQEQPHGHYLSFRQ